MTARTTQSRRQPIIPIALLVVFLMGAVATPVLWAGNSVQQRQAAAIKAAQQRATQARAAQQAAVRAAQERARQAQQQALARQRQMREQAQRNAAAAQAAQRRAVEAAQARQRELQAQAQRNIAAARDNQRRAIEAAQARQRQAQQDAQKRAGMVRENQQRARNQALARQREMQEQAQRNIAAAQETQRRAVAEAQVRQRRAQDQLQERRRTLQQQAQRNIQVARETQQRNLQQAQQTAAANLATAAEAQRQVRRSVLLRQERLQARGDQVVEATQAAGKVHRNTAWNPLNRRSMRRQHRSVDAYHDTLDEHREQTGVVVDRAEHRLTQRQGRRTEVLLNQSQTDWSQYTPAEAAALRVEHARELYQANLGVTLAGQEMAHAHGLNQHAQAWKLSAVKQDVEREVAQAERIIYPPCGNEPYRPFWKRRRPHDVEVSHHLTIVNNEVHVVSPPAPVVVAPPVQDTYYDTTDYYDDSYSNFNDCSSINYGNLPVDTYIDHGTGHLSDLPGGRLSGIPTTGRLRGLPSTGIRSGYGYSYTNEACGVSPYGRTSAYGVSAFGRPSMADYRCPPPSFRGHEIYHCNRKWSQLWDHCYRRCVSPMTYHRSRYFWRRWHCDFWQPYWQQCRTTYYYPAYYAWQPAGVSLWLSLFL